MQVAGIREAHGPVETIEVPDPRALAGDEALIQVRAAGVGNWDEIVRTGQWDVGRTPPLALGVEAAGVVAAIGQSGTQLHEGDEVLTHPLPLREQGTWAPWLIAPTALLVKRPRNVTSEVAAAFPVPALTADQVVAEALEITGDEWLLVHGGAGVTGSLIVSLAVARGATVIATASPSNRARLQGLGAAHVVDYHDPQWTQQVASIPGQGVDAAANAVRGGAADAMLTVRAGGRVATITSDPPMAERDIKVSSVYVRADGPRLQSLVGLLEAGRLHLSVGSMFGLADAAAALSAAVHGHGGRAIVLRPT